MQPLHPDFQKIAVEEHVETLRRASVNRPSHGLRRRAGSMLVAAGFRLAPELRPRGRRVRPAGPAA
jgi:hypothetical protein